MSISISISVEDAGIRENMAMMIRMLSDRSGVNEAISKHARAITREYLLVLAETKHATAARLGADPTGHLSRAAENTSATFDAQAATVTVKSPGISRAARDVTITPTGGRQWLTLPMISYAYGRTVSQVQRELAIKLFRPIRKGARGSGLGITDITGRKVSQFEEADKMNVLATSVPGGGMQFVFALVRSVFQRQDRELLPSDIAYMDAAKAGVRDYISFLFGKGGLAS